MIIVERLKRLIPLFVIGLIGIVLFMLLRDNEFSETDSDELVTQDVDDLSLELVEDPQVETAESTEVIVDVKGEVKKPGVYTVDADERVQTVIELAGGLTGDANEQQINLAQKVEDEMVIYVPTEGEESEIVPALPQAEATAGNDGQSTTVQVNSATEAELTELQGIGPSKAQAIIDYREEHGPFQQVEDLLEVSGIGEKTLENIRNQIIVP